MRVFKLLNFSKGTQLINGRPANFLCLSMFSLLWLGLCPQQNIIFEELTPREHLKIFAGIKGIPGNEIDGMVCHCMLQFELSASFDQFSNLEKFVNATGSLKVTVHFQTMQKLTKSFCSISMKFTIANVILQNDSKGSTKIHNNPKTQTCHLGPVYTRSDPNGSVPKL